MKTEGGSQRWRRALRALGIGLTAVLVAVVGVLYFLVATHAGLLVLCSVTKSYFGAGMQFGAVHGRLAGRFEIDDLQFTRANGFRLKIGRLHVDWTPTDLLTGHLHLNAVNLDNLFIGLPESTAKSRKWSRSVPKMPALPIVGIAVDSLAITELEIHNPGRPLMHLGPTHFSGNWEGRSLRIKSLSILLPGIGPIAIRGKLDSQTDGIRVHSLQLRGPGNVDISGTIGYETSASHLSIRWRHLNWPLTGRRKKLASHISGTARLAGNLSRYSYAATSHLMMVGRPITIVLSGDGDSQRTQIAHIRMDAGALGSVKGHGQIAWGVNRRTFAELRILRVNLKPLLPGLQSKINGRLDIGLVQLGNKPLANVALHLEHSTVRGYPLTLGLTGVIGRNEGKLTELDARVSGGILRGNGLIRWPAPLSGHLNLQIKNIRPELLETDLPGHLNGRLKIELNPRKTSEQIVALNGVLDHSTIRGKPLHLRIEGRLSKQANKALYIDLSNLTAELGRTRLAVQGRASQPFDLNGRFRSPNLGILSSTLGGQLAFDFQLQGSPEKLHLKTHGQGRNLRRGQYRIGRLQWTANVNTLNPSNLHISIGKTTYAALKISSGTLDAQGAAHHQRIHLRLVAPRGTINLHLAGGYDRRRRQWLGRVTSLQVLPARLPAWGLSNKPILEIGRRRLALGLTCMKSGTGRMCLELRRGTQPSGVKVAWSMNNVRLSPFKALLGRRESIAGQLSGRGHLRWAQGNIDDAQGNLVLSDAHLRFGGAPPVSIRRGRVTVTQNHLGTVNGFLDLSSPQGTINAQVVLAPGSPLVKRPLTGSVTLNVPHLAILQPYLMEVQALDGQIRGALTLSGTIEHPKVRGHMALAGGHARIGKAGIMIKNVSIQVSGQGTAPLHITGQATSGGGILRLWGTLNLTQSPLSINVHVKGNRFQVMNTLDGHVWVDPDLHILRNLQGVHLTGEIKVPKANLTPRSGATRHRGIGPSSDQIIVGHSQTNQTRPPAVFARLAVHLGKAVRFDGYGLTTGIIGQVTVNETPQRMPTANGRLQLVDGRYKAYGQNLTLKKGELIFDGGPLIEPAIDILAIRKPREGIEVGVHVRGRLSQPKLSLTSTPPMRREEQLSWLFFGHPLSENSSANRSAIASAALALGLSGGNYLADRIGKTLGIGNLSIGTSNEAGSAVAAQPQAISGAAAGAGSATAAGSEAAQLTLGKYLTPRLYVSYGVGLFQAAQAFQLRYKLGRGLELQTESGVSTGGDLIYTFEGGK